MKVEREAHLKCGARAAAHMCSLRDKVISSKLCSLNFEQRRYLSMVVVLGSATHYTNICAWIFQIIIIMSVHLGASFGTLAGRAEISLVTFRKRCRKLGCI